MPKKYDLFSYTVSTLLKNGEKLMIPFNQNKNDCKRFMKYDKKIWTKLF